MKASYEDLHVLKANDSFRAFRREASAFEFNWHYHPEYEITWIEKGSGRRLVGDHYESFGPGDLVLIGKDLPHTWASDKLLKGKSSAVVIQFREDILKSLLSLPEFGTIKEMLSRSKLGLYYPGKNISEITGLMKDLPGKRGAERVAGLLQILGKLCHKKHIRLASPWFQPLKGDLNEKRIIRVCRYVHENSAEEVSIDRASALIHLSKSAFCKFFKRTTGKTFSDYVNEIRIGHACHLILESDKPIAEICSRAGFESITYFNRVFFRKKGVSPKDFRKLQTAVTAPLLKKRQGD